MKKNLQDICRFGCIICGHAIVHLVILFGVSTWIGVNEIFVELPLFVNIAPEGWDLSAYVVIVTQSANRAPAIHRFLHKCKCRSNKSLYILFLLCLQILNMGLSIFLYDMTITVYSCSSWYSSILLSVASALYCSCLILVTLLKSISCPILLTKV